MPFNYTDRLYYISIPAESEETTEPTPYPNCGSSESNERETGQCVLEDGTIRYAVISEEFVRMEIDRQVNDE
jgi:hypothetical protein